jgi:hypothetical protein
MSNDEPKAVPADLRLSDGLGALVARLRNASHGYDEWRVQDPKDGAYCIAFSWPETMNPERAAREWLADHKARFPGGLHTDYVVACVRVMPEKDRLLLAAADELERLAAGPWIGKCQACGHEHEAPNAEVTGLGRNRSSDER